LDELTLPRVSESLAGRIEVVSLLPLSQSELRGAKPSFDEVDLMVESGDGALIGIEVKIAASVGSGDFKGLRKLSEACGNDFKLGVVLYDGSKIVPFGERLFAAPLSCLWA
jgi:predicted AAA+ superfamily ATPase